MKKNNIDEEISQRISIVRYLMIVGVVFLHVPPYVPLSEMSSDFFSFVKALFSNAIFRSTTPVLTCISGYILYSVSLDRKYRSLVVNKTRSLLVPLILWNVPLVFVLYFVQKYRLLDQSFSTKIYPIAIFSSVNAIVGFNGSPLNYPLNFIRDLYVITLLAPIFGYLLRRIPFIGLVFISLFFLGDLDGDLVLRNSMPVNFYIGGMAALAHWDLRFFDRYALPLIICFLALSIAIVVFRIPYIYFFSIISPFLIWPIFSKIPYTLIGEKIIGLSKVSFFVFLSHGPILFAISVLFSKFVGNLSTFTFWLMAPILTILIAHISYFIFSKIAPAALGLLIGGRHANRE